VLHAKLDGAAGVVGGQLRLSAEQPNPRGGRVSGGEAEGSHLAPERLAQIDRFAAVRERLVEMAERAQHHGKANLRRDAQVQRIERRPPRARIAAVEGEGFGELLPSRHQVTELIRRVPQRSVAGAQAIELSRRQHAGAVLLGQIAGRGEVAAVVVELIEAAERCEEQRTGVDGSAELARALVDATDFRRREAPRRRLADPQRDEKLQLDLIPL